MQACAGKEILWSLSLFPIPLILLWLRNWKLYANVCSRSAEIRICGQDSTTKMGNVE